MSPDSCFHRNHDTTIRHSVRWVWKKPYVRNSVLSACMDPGGMGKEIPTPDPPRGSVVRPGEAMLRQAAFRQNLFPLHFAVTVYHGPGHPVAVVSNENSVDGLPPGRVSGFALQGSAAPCFG